MNYKIKTLAIAVLMATGAGVANANGQTCDVDMAYDVNLNGNEIVFTKNNQESVVIKDSNSLSLDGKAQSLTAKQVQLLHEYAQQVRELLPAASEIAEDASLLALEAVRDVTGVLLEHNPTKAEEIIARVDTIAAELKTHISESHLRPEAIGDYLAGAEFEKEFEALMEESITEFVQVNIPTMVAAAMSGNEEKVKAFEERMEKFGQDMESKYEAKAKIIEQKADALCDLVKQIEAKEDSFVKAFADYEKYQLIQ
ncbi:DUF2884 family protein [Kangiella aquimarina]|uniref:DUF2884 family protein n=1 Tax=Kangiella aquimarina TaxID=261965 RepID=A0ABZ0X182_9GAMM|nr:DUF2884 family protein [Kangiella aquimarina]WQG84313.1 DUF2884 family protein [Kangiella aquimarina]